MDWNDSPEQAAFRRDIEQAQRAGNAKAFSKGHAKTIPFVDQQHVSVKRFGQRDSGGDCPRIAELPVAAQFAHKIG